MNVPATNPPNEIRISRDDVSRFARASHDVNPLHVDAAYARLTSFGRPVVYGVLGALHAISLLPAQSRSLEKITIEFQGPLFEDTPYDVVIDGAGSKWKCAVKEGARSLLKATLVFAGDLPSTPRTLDASPSVAPRTQARPTKAFAAGDSIALEWVPEHDALRELTARLEIEARGLSTTHVAALLAASYVVGMEMPGEQALFARLALTFGKREPARSTPTTLEATVESFDERFRMLTLDVDLCGAAAGELRALVRPPPVEIDGARVVAALGELPPATPEDVVAVVVGGGRGIGGAIAVALAKSGARRVVTTYASARSAAERLMALDSKIVAVEANAEDPSGAKRVVDALNGAPIALVVLSASPAVLGLSVGSAETASRVVDFVGRSLSLAVTPLVSLAEHLAKNAKIVVVSSSYVDDPPKDFSHYAAAKAAIEAFARSFARDRGLSLLIARPPRVLTDMTNTAFGTEDTLRAEDVAAIIVNKALRTSETLVSDFSRSP